MGGVLLVAILLTTMLLYFITILDNDQRRASYDIQSAQINQDKSAESLEASRDQDLFTNGTGSYINAVLNNDGSLPLIVSYATLFCIDDDCPTPNNPIIAQTDKTLNAKEVTTRHVGPVSDSLNYRVDFITERGNIVSTEECVVDLGAGICTNDESGIPDFILSADPKVLVMEAGNSAQSTITVTSVSGFSSDVTLSASSPDGGNVIGNFNINPVTPSGNSNLTISSDDDTTPGTYAMVISGTDGSISHQTTISLTILEEECVTCAVTEGIIQGTGSLQLDFRAFGVIYPQLGTRDGIDQSGWASTVASKFSSVHGYPGFQLMTITASTGGGNPVSTTKLIVVESARNLDQSGEDLILTRFTGINPSLGAIQGSNSQLSFICKEDTSAKTVSAYDEDSAYTELAAVPITSDQTVGWTEMYFCTTNAGASPNYFTPADLKFANLTPLFLVARGDFADGSPYSQTIPYQAFTIGKGAGSTNLNACLLSGDTNTECPGLVDNQGNPINQLANAAFMYDATELQLQNGVTVWLHVNAGPVLTNGIDIRWLYPDGTYETLLTNQQTSAINGNGNIPVDLPSITCTNAGTDEFHTLVFNDGRDNNGDRYIYYMTFKVDC
jgi:hypothetical protein